MSGISRTLGGRAGPGPHEGAGFARKRRDWRRLLSVRGIAGFARRRRRLLGWRRWRLWLLGSRVKAGSGVSIGPRNIIICDPGGTIILGEWFSSCRDVELVAYRRATIELGRHTYVGHGSTIAAYDSIRIGDHTLVADLVSIRDYNHGFARDVPPDSVPGESKPIVLGKNCWLGSKATIVAGVSLGDNVVVGANSVVTHSFGANLVIAGCPARVVREL